MDTVVDRAGLAPLNLRQRALLAAHRVLEAEGEANLNLRAIAAEVGTGVGSLYYHFASKDALLAELAADGFRELARWMSMARPSERDPTPFHAAGHAYLGFTRRRPALYAIMYNERILARYEVARRAEAEAFEVFARSLEGVGPPGTNHEDVALAFWALGRGMASVSSSLAGTPGVSKDVVRRVLSGLEALTGAALAPPSDARKSA